MLVPYRSISVPSFVMKVLDHIFPVHLFLPQRDIERRYGSFVAGYRRCVLKAIPCDPSLVFDISDKSWKDATIRFGFVESPNSYRVEKKKKKTRPRKRVRAVLCYVMRLHVLHHFVTSLISLLFLLKKNPHTSHISCNGTCT